ncbi:PAS domain-containing protein [Ralstonia sp. UBA689]|uniref:PAS domain-containing protein n=1 Tax=Ralstonia sp. UBA689 TaxID=1947373 RepID=UPI0025F26DB0|nr:PAS domain-containing protein [Ralstonia sp. UBA689]
MTTASLPPPDGPLDDDSFADRLKGVLTRGRIQLKQVAAALGVSPSAVHKWTRGGEIEYANLLALARFLNVNWLWLRYGDRALADLEASLNTDARAREGRQKHLAAIMESEARMTFAQEISGVVTWEWNLLTDAVAYSPNAVRLFGRQIRTLDDFWRCVVPEDVPGVQAAITQNLATGGVYAHEFRIAPAPDAVRWIVSRATLVRDAQDRPVKMIGLSLDITERRTAEAALRDSEALLAKAQQIAHLGSWLWEPGSDACRWTDEAYRIFGWVPAKPVTMAHYLATIVPADRARVQAVLDQAVATRRPYRVEYSITLPDGTRRHIREEGEAQDPAAATPVMIGAAQDVTDEVEAQAAFRDSEAKLRTLFEQAPVGIAHVSLEGRCLRANPWLCGLLGQSEAELQQRTLLDLTHRDDLARHLRQYGELLAGTVPAYALSLQLVRGDGSAVPVRVTTSLARDPISGAPLHLITVVDAVPEAGTS